MTRRAAGVLICFCLWAGVAGSMGAVAQGLPDFGALDAGGMPACLIELQPQKQTAGWVLEANTPYAIWAAPKLVGRGYRQSAWRAFGPFQLAGERRYLFTWDGSSPGGSLADSPTLTGTTPILSPAVASLHLQNLDGDSVWLIANPLPPGCADATFGPDQRSPDGTGVSSDGRERQALKYAAEILERNRVADENSLPVEFQLFETAGSPSIRVTTGIDSVYLVKTDSPQALLEAQVKETLAYDSKRWHRQVSGPAGVAIDHIDSRPEDVGMAGSMSTMKWVYPNHLAYVVTTADFGNLGLYYARPDARADTVQKRTERCLVLVDALHRGMLEAGLTGAAPAEQVVDDPAANLEAARARLARARSLYTRLVTTGTYDGDPYRGDVALALRDYQAALATVERLQSEHQ